MRLFDTHAHLCDEAFADDLPAVLERLRAAGVQMALIVADALKSPETAYELAEREGFFRACAVHPHDASSYADEAEATIRRLAPRAAAVGEIGLDYHYDYSPREIQREVFERQLDLALELRKPVILHIREAHGDALDILGARARQGRLPGGVMHCFGGSWESARQYLDMGLYISFSGSLTFKNAPRLTEVAKNAPADRLLVETDCPYMAPVPLRGRRNEPAFVEHTLKKLAELRGADAEEFAETTYQNGMRLFS